MGSNKILIDGDYSSATPVGPRRVVYPFRQFGDRVTTGFEEDNWQTESTWQPDALGRPYGPSLPGYFLLAESDPRSLLSNLVGFTRTWSRIPGDQITYGSQAITKPAVPNKATVAPSFNVQNSGGASGNTALGAGVYYSGTPGAYLFSPEQYFYGPLLAGAYTAPIAATGGTFTVTYKTSTTGALAYNATCVAVAAAINALAAVVADGLTVAINGGVGNMWSAAFDQTLTVTVGSTTSPFTFNGASLTGVTLPKCFTLVTNATTQDLQLAGKIAATAHGLSGSLKLATVQSDVATTARTALILQPTYGYTVYDANTLATIQGLPASLLIGPYVRSYTPGADRLGLMLTQKFYLPGVTSGITTGADIPIPQPLLNDADFLAAALTNPTGYVTYDATPLQFWNGSPIYTQTLTAINMADV